MTEDIRTIAEFVRSVMQVLHVLRHPVLFLNFLNSIAYWVATIICVLCIIYHATTGCPKPARVMTYTLITYILIKGVSMAL